MAEFLYDLRLASRQLPEANTPRVGGELVYAGKASRLGVAVTEVYTDNEITIQAMAVGDFANFLIQVPLRESWFLRGFGMLTAGLAGATAQVKASLHMWKPQAIYNLQADAWVNPNLNESPPIPPQGLEPFAYSERNWRQISTERTISVNTPNVRFLEWILDKDLWQRHLYSREILLTRIEVSAGNGTNNLQPHLDLVRYPSEEEIIRRLVQRDGAIRADVTLAAIIQATQDRLALDD